MAGRGHGGPIVIEDAEAWRDALLAVTGELNHELGGPTFDLGNMSNPRRTVSACGCRR